MSFQIDQSLSLMIPRVFLQWTGEQVIIDIFHQQHIGRIYKVSIIRTPGTKKRGYPIYQAYIYFSAWYENEIAYNFQQRIFGPRGQARVVYDDPWFWVVFENKKRSLSNNDKRLMRLGAQDYQNEEAAVALEERVRFLENWRQAQEVQEAQQAEQARNLAERQEQLQIHFKEINQWFKAFYTQALSETATRVAEAALDDTRSAFVPSALAPAFVPASPVPAFVPASQALVFTPPSATEPRMNPLNEEFAMMTIGEELALTETAMNVAEAALYEENMHEQWNSFCSDPDDDDDHVPICNRDYSKYKYYN